RAVLRYFAVRRVSVRRRRESSRSTLLLTMHKFERLYSWKGRLSELEAFVQNRVTEISSVRRYGRPAASTFAWRHLKLEMQSGNLVAGMILGISKLRLPVKQLWFG